MSVFNIDTNTFDFIDLFEPSDSNSVDEEEIPPKKRSKTQQHPFAKTVKKMLRDHNLEYENLQVVANLICAAENMARETLKEAANYEDRSTKNGDSVISKSSIELAIKLRYLSDNIAAPGDDKMISYAVAVNCIPLVIKDTFGIPLPKDHLGHTNYLLQHPSKRVKLEFCRPNPPRFFIPPYRQFKPMVNPLGPPLTTSPLAGPMRTPLGNPMRNPAISAPMRFPLGTPVPSHLSNPMSNHLGGPLGPPVVTSLGNVVGNTLVSPMGTTLRDSMGNPIGNPPGGPFIFKSWIPKPTINQMSDVTIKISPNFDLRPMYSRSAKPKQRNHDKKLKQQIVKRSNN